MNLKIENARASVTSPFSRSASAPARIVSYVDDDGDALDDLGPPRAPFLTFASASPNSRISALSARLAEWISELARELLPNGCAQGETWRVGGLDGAAGDSMTITLSGNYRGRWRDFATDQKGDALNLVKGVLGYETPEAIAWAKEWLDRGAEVREPAPKAGDDGDEDGHKARRIKWALAIWNNSINPSNTLVDTYLSRRGLKLTDALADHVIRFNGACPWGRDAYGKTVRVPAMIVAMRSIATDEITAIHRTRLSEDAEKIGRRMLGQASDAAVKLDADESVTDRLTIGEGIETCMTAQQIGLTPTWALGSADAIEDFPVLDGVELLQILGERDPTSERVRTACATRWREAGRKVVLNHSKVGKDLNDGLQAMLDAPRGRRVNPHELYFEAPFLPPRSTIETAGGAGNRSAGDADAISEAELPPAPQRAIALRSGGAGAVSETGLPEIHVVAGQLPRIVDEAEAALLAFGRPIFVRAGALVQPIAEEWPAARGRTTTIAKLRNLQQASLIDLLAQSATFLRPDVKGLVATDPPVKVASILLEREDAWKFPRVAGIITTPTLRPDGSVLSSPGYDASTRLYLALDPKLKMRDIPHRPTKSDAERALRLLSGLLRLPLRR